MMNHSFTLSAGQIFPVYGMISAVSLAVQARGLSPFRAARGHGIDGLAKMPLPASIFASWYYITIFPPEMQPPFAEI